MIDFLSQIWSEIVYDYTVAKHKGSLVWFFVEMLVWVIFGGGIISLISYAVISLIF